MRALYLLSALTLSSDLLLANPYGAPRAGSYVGGEIGAPIYLNGYALGWDDDDDLICSAATDDQLVCTVEDSGTNNVLWSYRWQRTTSGTASAGFGEGLAFRLETASGTSAHAGGVYAYLIDPTGGAVSTGVCIQTQGASSDVTASCWDGNGSQTILAGSEIIWSSRTSISSPAADKFKVCNTALTQCWIADITADGAVSYYAANGSTLATATMQHLNITTLAINGNTISMPGASLQLPQITATNIIASGYISILGATYLGNSVVNDIVFISSTTAHYGPLTMQNLFVVEDYASDPCSGKPDGALLRKTGAAAPCYCDTNTAKKVADDLACF